MNEGSWPQPAVVIPRCPKNCISNLNFSQLMLTFALHFHCVVRRDRFTFSWGMWNAVCCMCVGQHKIVQIPFEINLRFADIVVVDLYRARAQNAMTNTGHNYKTNVIAADAISVCILFLPHFFFARTNVSIFVNGFGQFAIWFHVSLSNSKMEFCSEWNLLWGPTAKSNSSGKCLCGSKVNSFGLIYCRRNRLEFALILCMRWNSMRDL